MIAAEFPWLSLLIGLPLLGALITGFLGGRNKARAFALAVALAELTGMLLLIANFDISQNDQFQFVEQHAWIAGR